MVHEGQSVCDIGPRSRFFVAGGTGGGFSRPTRITVNTVSRVDFVVTCASCDPKAHTAGSREMAKLTFVAMDHANYRFTIIVTGSTIDRLHTVVRFGIVDRCPAEIVCMTSVTMGTIVTSEVIAWADMVDEGQAFDI